MVDYFPIMARAVATLNLNTREQRYALYDRARRTLVDKLRAFDPNLSHTDLRAESAALEAAIQRVERDVVNRAAPPQRPPTYDYQDRPPLVDTRKRLRIAAGVVGAFVILAAGVAAYSFGPRLLSDARTAATTRSAPVVEEEPATKSGYVNLRQLVYYRTNQPVGTIIVDKTQTFLYVVRPNVSALRYSIGVGTECVALAGLYHVVRKEDPAKQSGDTAQDKEKSLLGARVLYLDKDYRIHGFDASTATGQRLPPGCIRLVNDDVIYLYDHTPLESRVVVSN